jgi:hypothetical protein
MTCFDALPAAGSGLSVIKVIAAEAAAGAAALCQCIIQLHQLTPGRLPGWVVSFCAEEWYVRAAYSDDSLVQSCC